METTPYGPKTVYSKHFLVHQNPSECQETVCKSLMFSIWANDLQNYKV